MFALALIMFIVSSEVSDYENGDDAEDESQLGGPDRRLHFGQQPLLGSLVAEFVADPHDGNADHRRIGLVGLHTGDENAPLQ